MRQVKFQGLRQLLLLQKICKEACHGYNEDDLVVDWINPSACPKAPVKKERLCMSKRKAGLIVDFILYALMLTQMLYIFTTNNVHEVIGIVFFVCLIIHLILKKWWFKAAFRKGQGVSRFLFPWFTFLGSSGYGSTISDIKALCPDATIVPGTSIYCEDVPDAREELLKTIKSWNGK